MALMEAGAPESSDDKSRHLLDYVVERSWWIALAYHFQATGQVRYAYALLLAFFPLPRSNASPENSFSAESVEAWMIFLDSIDSCALSRDAATFTRGCSRSAL
jgi:hypothetical protein